MKHHTKHLQALEEVARVLSRQVGQSEVLAKVLEILTNHLGMQRATVMLVSSDGNRLNVEASSSQHIRPQSGVGYDTGQGITGRVLESGKPAIVPRIADEPLFEDRLYTRNEAERLDLSYICVPVVQEDKVVGTISTDICVNTGCELNEIERVLNIVAAMIAYDAKSRRERRLERERLETENLKLRLALGENFRPGHIIGHSRAMHRVYERIQQVAGSDTTVVIRGESGTGKELVASAIHYSGLRKDKPFIKVNCAQMNENLLESELFGHEQGAFTGAQKMRVGLLEEAEGGTIFFDEIGEFSPAIQVKLLRVIQEREFQRVGSNRVRKANVRVVAATNCDLEKAVEEGAFRQDLYYRIFVFPVYLPPLRERRDDIPQLADHFVAKHASKMVKNVRRISTTAINMMSAYHWPGNVRELENCVEYSLLLCKDEAIQGQDLPPTLQMPEMGDLRGVNSLKAQISILEKDAITDSLKRHNGNVSAVARDLGITARIVRYKMEKLAIKSQKK